MVSGIPDLKIFWMAQQLIVPGVTNGQQASDIINGNFSELYASLPVPIRLKNVNVNTNQLIAANTKIVAIDISGTAGAPVLRVGLTPNGTELLPDTPIGNTYPLEPNYYSAAGDTLYFTISGPAGSTVSIRITQILNFY